MIRVRCPSCEQLLGISEGTVGNTTTCPQCAHRFRVSATDEVKKLPPRATRVTARPNDTPSRTLKPAPKAARRAPARSQNLETAPELPRFAAPRRERLVWVIAAAAVVIVGGAFATYHGLFQSGVNPVNVVPNVANAPPPFPLPKVVNVPQQAPLPPAVKPLPENVLVRADLFVTMPDGDVKKLAGNNVVFIPCSISSDIDVKELRQACRTYRDLTMQYNSLIAGKERFVGEQRAILESQRAIAIYIDSLLSKSKSVNIVTTDKDGSLETSLKPGDYLLRTDQAYLFMRWYMWTSKVTVVSPMPKIVLNARYENDVKYYEVENMFYDSLADILK